MPTVENRKAESYVKSTNDARRTNGEGIPSSLRGLGRSPAAGNVHILDKHVSLNLV
jgi:hypothetical protein